MKIKNSLSKIISNTGYLVGERVFNLGVSLFVGIWVARYLGPENFGLWRYSVSLVGLGTGIATLGTTQIVVRDLITYKADAEGSILGTTFILMLIAGSITAIVIIILGLLLNNDALTRWLIIISSTNLVLMAFNTFDYWFQAKVLAKYSVIARTSTLLLISILKISFILLGLNVIYFAFTIVVSGIFQMIIWLYYYQKSSISIKNWHFDILYAKILLKNSWPLILSGISVAIYMKIDQVMIKSMMDANSVGNYAVAAKISELWYFIPTSVAISVFPSIIQSKKNQIKYHERLQNLYDFMVLISFLIAIPMTFFSNSIIELLFGLNYIFAGKVLSVHIWSSIFVFLGVARNKWIINENYQFYGMIFTIAGALINVILNYWLIPSWGIVGAAWSTLISQGTSAWLMALFFDKTKLAFKMQTQAIINVILILPAIKSLRHILKNAF